MYSIDDEVGRLLDATAVRELTVVLPSTGRTVSVPAYRRAEDRWTDVLPANFRTIPNKVAVEYSGRPVYPEFAIIGRLQLAGWQAVWRVNWHQRAFWTDIGIVGDVPAWVLEEFNRISAAAGRGGAWDILAWKSDRRLFIESKQRGSDKLTANQLRWLEVALADGVPSSCFAVYEYVA